MKASQFEIISQFNTYESHRKQKVVNLTTPLPLVAPLTVILRTHGATSDDQVAKTTTLKVKSQIQKYFISTIT